MTPIWISVQGEFAEHQCWRHRSFQGCSANVTTLSVCVQRTNIHPRMGTQWCHECLKAVGSSLSCACHHHFQQSCPYSGFSFAMTFAVRAVTKPIGGCMHALCAWASLCMCACVCARTPDRGFVVMLFGPTISLYKPDIRVRASAAVPRRSA